MSVDLVSISSRELKQVPLTVSRFTPTTAAVTRAFNSLLEIYTSLQMEKIKVIFTVSNMQLPHPHPIPMVTLLEQLAWETNSDKVLLSDVLDQTAHPSHQCSQAKPAKSFPVSDKGGTSQSSSQATVPNTCFHS